MVYVGVVAPKKSIKIESTGGVFWRIGMSPNISINWAARDDKVTLPIGLGAGRMVTIGPLPVNIHGEIDDAVMRPDDTPGSRWGARVYITAVIPTFVF